MTSTLTQAGGHGFALGDYIINVTEGEAYLITEITSATTLTFTPLKWWMTVIQWNPCNNILDLI